MSKSKLLPFDISNLKPVDYTEPHKVIYLQDAFNRAMVEELEANAHKGSFLLWTPTPDVIRVEIGHHTEKLVQAMYSCDRERTTEYAADIANYALKAFSIYPSPRYWDAVRGVPIRH